jgi:pyruvate formate lyase activating enzyme
MKKEAMLYKSMENGSARCDLCAHHCKIAPDQFGFCGVRQNIEGRLHTHVYGEVIARNVDPIEKKPLYHFLPGSSAYSVATIGCNFHCSFCQNWQISQISQKNEASSLGENISPEEIVEDALKNHCSSIAYTYTEPTIFFEYAYETSKLAYQSGLRNLFITNGYMTYDALDTIAPYLDGVNVDLKGWSEEYYSNLCQAHLKPVVNSIKYIRKLGIWLEITTLIIPQEHDTESELEGIAKFIAETGVDIPWHISRFHPGYQLIHHQATPLATLEKAKEIGMKNGLRYIYLGNVPADKNTYCPQCGELLIERSPEGNKVNLKNSTCPSCNFLIQGVWV